MAADTTIFRLDHLRQVAAIVWQMPTVTNRQLSAWSGASDASLRKMALNEATQIDYENLGGICWVFGCKASDLLMIVPRSQVHDFLNRGPLTLDEITAIIQQGIIHPKPPTGPKPPEAQLISHIPELLRSLSIEQRNQLGIQRATLHQMTKKRERISNRYLALLVNELAIPLDELLVAPRRDEGRDDPAPAPNTPAPEA